MGSDGAAAVFRDYAERLHSFCKETLEKLEERHPELRRPFADTAFAGITFNFGPGVCTFPHKDCMNLSWGWCSITALGEYDHRKGGHIILWDLGVAVEFPAHSTILIPSAIVKHSNASIQEGERRQSVTQYNSVGLFRWRAYGFQLQSTAEKKGVRPEEWWSKPHHMFSYVH